MSKATYTSGPWDVHESNAIVGQKLDDHPIWLRPVIARFETGVKEADARLMAAAPELLEALQDLKRELILSNVDIDYIESHFRKSIDKAEAAISKAIGDRLGEMAAIDRIAKATGQPA